MTEVKLCDLIGIHRPQCDGPHAKQGHSTIKLGPHHPNSNPKEQQKVTAKKKKNVTFELLNA
jgi:hypothetical protein